MQKRLKIVNKLTNNDLFRTSMGYVNTSRLSIASVAKCNRPVKNLISKHILVEGRILTLDFGLAGAI